MRRMSLALAVLAISTFLVPIASAQDFNDSADPNLISTPGTPHYVIVLPGGTALVPPALAPLFTPGELGR